MKEFEYKFINFPDFDFKLEKILNEYGEMGWEVVGYSSDVVFLTEIRRNHHFILKREKNKNL